MDWLRLSLAEAETENPHVSLGGRGTPDLIKSKVPQYGQIFIFREGS